MKRLFFSRQIAAFFILSVLVGGSLSPAYAEYSSTMNGQTCKKSGQISRYIIFTYQCKVVGGKRIWQLQPSQDKTRKVPQTDFLNTLTDTLRKDIRSIGSRSDKVNFVIQPGYEKTLWTRDIVQSVDMAMRLRELLTGLKSPITTGYIFWDYEWAKSVIPDTCRHTGAGVACGDNGFTVELKWFAESRNHENKDPNQYQNETQRYLIASHVPHEITHLMQADFRKSNPDNLVYELEPAWLREGGPSNFALIIYALRYNLSYEVARQFGVDYIGARCASTSLKELSGQGSTQAGCEYNNGVMASEYLIWKMRDIRAPFLFSSKAQRVDGQDGAFKKVYGISLDAFITEADSYIKKVSYKY
jgi:hypothetical protein